MPLDRTPDRLKNKVDPHVGNRGKRVVFIPWDVTEGDEWAIKTAQWNHSTGNKFEIVFWDGGRPNMLLVQAGSRPDAAIYIRGHGNPGVPYIQVKVDVGGPTLEERKLLIVEACDRLMGTGLHPSFRGAIKFFHCHSGTVLTPDAYEQELRRAASNNRTVQQGVRDGTLTLAQRDKFWKHVHPNKSIARIGADYMRKKGFKSCVFYGYLGPLASEYADDGHGAWHKEVELAGLQNGPAALAGMATARASRGRVQV